MQLQVAGRVMHHSLCQRAWMQAVSIAVPWTGCPQGPLSQDTGGGLQCNKCRRAIWEPQQVQGQAAGSLCIQRIGCTMEQQARFLMTMLVVTLPSCAARCMMQLDVPPASPLMLLHTTGLCTQDGSRTWSVSTGYHCSAAALKPALRAEFQSVMPPSCP